jgi:hypothetical protein
MEYKVLRPHQGDKWYAQGDPREASEGDVAHLVAAGVLEAVSKENGAGPDEENRDKPEESKVEPPVETGTQPIVETGAGSVDLTKAAP